MGAWSLDGAVVDISSAASVPTTRLDGLTGLRWWAAFMVFLFHIQVFAPIPGPLAAVFHQGYLGVTFFFVLSGFVLTWSWSALVRQSTFYFRRFARIYPLHVVGWLLALPVFYLVFPVDAPEWVKAVDAPALALSFVLLQGWSTIPLILFAGNPAAWTLTCEMFFYAIHPYAQRVLKRIGVRGALIAAAGVVAVAFAYRASAWLFDGTWWADLPAPIWHLPEFLLGMCLAWAVSKGWRPRIPVTLGVAALAGAVGAIVAAPALAPGSLVAEAVVRFGNELFTVACAVAIVAIASSAMRGRGSIFNGRIQVKLGEWSFAFYLVHATVMYAAMWVWQPLAPSWANVLPAFAVLAAGVALAAVLHEFVERPVERRLRRWKDARDRRAVSAGVSG